MDAQEHFALVRYVANRFPSQINGDFEDSELFSDGLLGLAKAIKIFETDKGKKFSTLAVKCIQNEIIQGLRTRNEKLDIKSFVEVHGDEEVTFEPIDERGSERKELVAEFVAEMLASESTPRSKILKQYYLDGKTLEEIGKKLSISREAVRHRIAKALKHFKRKFENNMDQYVLRGLEI